MADAVAAPGAAVGILGGGQLGRMLALAGARLGLDAVVLDPDPDAPAARIASRAIVGGYDDRAALAELAGQVRIATYEFENVPAASVTALTAAGVAVRPGAAALEVAQDRAREKRFLAGLGIPVAPWREVGSTAQAAAGFAEVCGAGTGGGGILKTRRFGYDGKGQRRVGSAEAAAAAFAELDGAPSVLERQLDFAMEFSVIGVRGAGGAEFTYEASRNLHEDGILRCSEVPAGLPPEAESTARDAVSRALDALDYVGAVAIEFFLLRDGAVLANEIAPRVHNSGHWTLDACDICQFEAHMRAVAGWPLPKPRRLAPARMRNLLGEEADAWRVHAGKAGSRVHLYGKRAARPGRKMGHVTALG